jgi:LacI family transcriptional regulator
MPKPRKNQTILSDIARSCGLSLAAVSLALNNKPGISHETRIRVLEIAHSMGYHIKIPDAASAAGSVKTIGLLIRSYAEDEVHANLYFSHIFSNIETVCHQMDISLMFSALPVDTEHRPLLVPPVLEKWDVDGIIVAGVALNEELARALSDRWRKVVLVDSFSQGWDFDSVLLDNTQGAVQETEYLLRKGHRRVAFIGGSDQTFRSYQERRQGFQQALDQHRLDPISVMDCLLNQEEICANVIKLMKLFPKITGIVAVNDFTAITAMGTLKEAGYRIPDDVSIVGFDDIIPAQNSAPALTTMRVDYRSVGRLAVQLLLNQTGPVERGRITSIFQPSLIERSSVAVV